jgi:hypothetical protein
VRVRDCCVSLGVACLQNGRRAEDAALAAGRRDIVPVLHGGAPLLGSASVESRRSSMALLEAESGVTGSVTSSIVTNDGDAVSEDSATLVANPADNGPQLPPPASDASALLVDDSVSLFGGASVVMSGNMSISDAGLGGEGEASLLEGEEEEEGCLSRLLRLAAGVAVQDWTPATLQAVLSNRSTEKVRCDVYRCECLVWCGVVWCGVVWCGVVWCGVVWCGVVWCGVMSGVRRLASLSGVWRLMLLGTRQFVTVGCDVT